MPVFEYKEEYKNAVEERQKKIAEYQQEISELQEAFAKAFGTQLTKNQKRSLRPRHGFSLMNMRW